MDEQTANLWITEVHEILKGREQFINCEYPQVRTQYHTHYEWPELDPLRHEACLCLIFGLYQAAITVTNHLLESLMTYGLATYAVKPETDETKVRGRAITFLVEQYGPALKEYSSINLGDKINRACSRGLITKEQKKRLNRFREEIRNAFSHADKGKTFGDKAIPVQSFHFNEDGTVQAEEKSEPQIADFIIVQGLAQYELAKGMATPYFLYIDSIARQIYKKLFPNTELEPS